MSESCRREEKKPISTSTINAQGGRMVRRGNKSDNLSGTRDVTRFPRRTLQSCSQSSCPLIPPSILKHLLTNSLVRLERSQSPLGYPFSPTSSILPATSRPADVHLLFSPSTHLSLRRSLTLPSGGNFGIQRPFPFTTVGMHFVWSPGLFSQATGFKVPSCGTENTNSTR
jgi:hypothetical protein